MNTAELKAAEAVRKEVRTHFEELLAKHRLSIDARGIAGWNEGHEDFEGKETMLKDRHLREAIGNFLRSLR